MQKVTKTVKSYAYDVMYIDTTEEKVIHTNLFIPEKNRKKALDVAIDYIGENGMVVKMDFTGVTESVKYSMPLSKFVLHAEKVD